MAPKFLIFYSLILLARQVYSALNIEGCPAGTMNVREDDELRLTCGPYDFEMSWYYSRDNTLGELIGHCYGIFCYPAQRHEFAMLGDSYPSIVKSYKSTLLFPTINRDEARVYYCKTNYSMSACRLRVTAPAEVVPENCRVWISDWQVQGECLVERMYASDDVYTCTWSVNNTQVTGVFERPLTTYRNNSRTYMRGVCSFRQEIPFNGYNFTHSISYTYKISIDPGPQDSLVTTINIEPPKKPEINCSETVLEGSTVICMCTSQNRGNPPAKFVWDGTNTDRLLLQNVSRQQSSTNYTCRQTWGPHGVINTTVNYTFTVACK
ncbi:uncharacterized protein LOC112568922 [Pomacea canaliculata]|uniref:uncharacterized protein LOC112568922 n=1 Tax=Pomacea canaliculata TaxID=400727 RepID=UPI000D7377F0|nr:uncharacterized protein LOC112568922 [Pomacea canaliculata]